MLSAAQILTLRRAASRLYSQVFEPVLRRYDLTQMEMDILLFLSNNTQYDTAAAIVSRRMLTKSQVSVSIERLVRRDLLSRTADPLNRRVLHLRVLPPAAEVVREGQSCQASYGEQLVRGFSEEERQTLFSLLDRMTENAREGCAACKAQR